MYNLRKAEAKDLDILKKWKAETIFVYAHNISLEEKNKIWHYIESNTHVSNYEIVTMDNKDIGCLSLKNEKNGILVDEIFLEKEYRNLGIGTSIIKDITKKYPTLYLWVYKKNYKAIRLYKRLGFEVSEETETRYLMKAENIL